MEHRAPIFADTFSLCQWLLERLDGQPGVLSSAVCTNVLKLLEAIVLALKGRLRQERLEEVDERLITLRLHLRLANTTGLLNEDQFLFALQAADRIGRQLGGWQRSMNMA